MLYVISSVIGLKIKKINIKITKIKVTSKVIKWHLTLGIQ